MCANTSGPRLPVAGIILWMDREDARCKSIDGKFLFGYGIDSRFHQTGWNSWFIQKTEVEFECLFLQNVFEGGLAETVNFDLFGL